MSLVRSSSVSCLPFGELGCHKKSAIVTPKYSGIKRSRSVDFDIDVEYERDIDSINRKTPSYDPTYSRSINYHLLTKEKKYIYTKKIFGPGRLQLELTENMRATLIDWLTDVARVLDLKSSTFFQAIHLLDHVLNISCIRKNCFQLLGSVCISLAAKLEEIKAPLIEDLVYLADKCFDVEHFLPMERFVLSTVNFDLMIPTRYQFAERFSLAADLSPKEFSMLKYILEISLRDPALYGFPSSMVTAAALNYSLQLLRPVSCTIWTPVLEYYTGYSEMELISLVHQLRELHANVCDSNLRNVCMVYEDAKNHFVALVQVPLANSLRFPCQGS